MTSTERDFIDRSGRMLAVVVLVYVAVFAIGFLLSLFQMSIHPFLAVLLGLTIVYVGLSYYYYRHPEQVNR